MKSLIKGSVFLGWLLAYLSVATAATPPMPNFYARRDYPVGGAVQVVDLDGDKVPDVIVVSGTINTLIGKGDGTFRVGPMTTLPGTYLPAGFFATDLNGNGYPDLVMTSAEALSVPLGLGICLGKGDGTFQPLVVYPGGDKNLGQVVVGDFNGDGIPDAVSSDDHGIWIWTGKGGGVFNPGVLTAVGGLQGSDMVTADFNGDGHLDLAIQFLGGFMVVFGNGDGTFQAPVIYPINEPPSHYIFSIAAGDLNLDGHTDVVLLPEGANYVLIYLNNGSGTFIASGKASIGNYSAVTVGDVNGDGIPDLVNETGNIALGLGNGKFQPPVYYPVETSGPSGLLVGPALADLRGNGRTDIVSGEGNRVSVLLNKGNGKFEDGIWTSLPGSGNCAAAADFNGDGKPDLAVPTTQGITILLGTGKATAPYATGTSIALSGPGCPITGDLNGDGIPDLLLGANGLGGVGAYLGNGDGTFTLASTTPVSPGFLVLGDFNHDGKVDFADSSNQLALGNGDGTFQAPVSIVANPPIGGFSWVAAGDVNNDGWTDLLLTNFNYVNALYIFLNNQHGGFTQTSITNSGGPETVFLGDLNGDGNLDAVVQMYFGYSVAVYLGDGKGGFTLKETLPYLVAASGPSPPAIGDVNGDGIPDLLMPTDGTVLIELGKGDGTFVMGHGEGVGPASGQILLENLHGQPASANLYRGAGRLWRSDGVNQ